MKLPHFLSMDGLTRDQITQLLDTAEEMEKVRQREVKKIPELRGVTIVNAGDGTHEHPTQALLDAYAMRKRLGDLAGKHVAICGDLLHSRVVRSNIFCLRTLGADVTLVAPPTLMPPGIDERAAQEGFRTSYDLDAVVSEVDALMMLRVQRERMSGGFFPTENEYTALYGLTRERLARMADHAVVCHPGPMNRGLEIAPEAADAARSLILDQVTAGVYTRMAVLFHVFSGDGNGATA